MKKRYIIYLCLIGLVLLQLFLPPVLPVIQLPGEAISRSPIFTSIFGKNLGFTNTAVGAILAALLVILLALVTRAPSRKADEVPTGFYNFMEMLIEGAYGYVANMSGKWARTFFPFFMTFILWIVIGNWLELVPGVDAIGKWETMGELAEHRAEAAGIHDEEELHHIYDEAMAANRGSCRQGGIFLIREGCAEEDKDWTIVPYVRAAATDLNFTLALAIISVVMTQYYGMKAQGLRYWNKFFVWKSDEIAKNPLAIMDTGVGLLEFISEIFKIVSFAFRLLGNIFAGQILLFVIGSLLPIGNLLFWHLEFGVGLLQGVVFALLTLTFMKGATESHHGDDHH